MEKVGYKKLVFCYLKIQKLSSSIQDLFLVAVTSLLKVQVHCLNFRKKLLGLMNEDYAFIQMIQSER